MATLTPEESARLSDFMHRGLSYRTALALADTLTQDDLDAALAGFTPGGGGSGVRNDVLANRGLATDHPDELFFARDDNGGQLYFSDGTTWSKAAGSGNGSAIGVRAAIATVSANVGPNSGTSYVDAPGLTITFPAVAGGVYRVRVKAVLGNTIANIASNIGLTDVANTVLDEQGYTPPGANGTWPFVLEEDVTVAAAGNVTYKVRYKTATGGNVFILAGATFKARITADRVA